MYYIQTISWGLWTLSAWKWCFSCCKSLSIRLTKSILFNL